MIKGDGQQFIIEGGASLKGEVSLAGAKNSGFITMIASLLSNQPSQITNCSQIGDNEIVKMVIKVLGGEVKQNGSKVVVSPKTVSSFQVPCELGELSRACSLFAAPLLSRFGQATFPMPGGDKIGIRPLDRHIAGLKALGVKVVFKDGVFNLHVPKEGLIGTKFRFNKNTHTGTEMLLMVAVGAKGKTILENAAEEPEIDDLIEFLNKMGAKIKRNGRTIEIEGVKEFSGAIHQVMPDRNEAVSFGIAALATNGEILVKKANPKVLTAFLEKVKEIGGNYEIEKSGIRFWRDGALKATNITTTPYPGFMTDWQPLWTLLMTQVKGVSIVHETIFESRFGYVSNLQKMGAKIEFFNPEVKNPQDFYLFNWEDNKPEYYHAIKISGPAKLKGQKLEIADIRAGATAILAALIASGRSELTGIVHVDRGYEDFDGRLRDLGASIIRTYE